MTTKRNEYKNEARAFAAAFLITSMATTLALEAVNYLPSLLGLTIIVSAGYCAGHYWANRSHGRNISRVGPADT